MPRTGTLKRNGTGGQPGTRRHRRRLARPAQHLEVTGQLCRAVGALLTDFYPCSSSRRSKWGRRTLTSTSDLVPPAMLRTAKCTDARACRGRRIAVASAAIRASRRCRAVRTPHYPAGVETWSTNHCRGMFAIRVDLADFVRFGSITVTDVAPPRSHLARPAALIAPTTAVWRKTRTDTGLEAASSMLMLL